VFDLVGSRERIAMAAEKRRIENETEKQRWDRNFADLLQELRVAQTGVQILFAFLLTLPFSNGFPKTTAFQKDIYLVALISAAAATAMIIAPVAFHRALFRQGRKPELVRYAHRMATTGVGFLLIAMVSSVLLITDYLLSFWPALILTVFVGAWFLTFWGLIPWFRHHWIDEDLEEEDEESSSGRVEPDTPDGVVNGDERPIGAPRS
jgi:amino acid permease